LQRDRCRVELFGDAVEGQCASKRNGVPAIDEPTPKTALALGKLIEMDAGRVLIETGGNLGLGFLGRDPVDMVDLVAGLIVAEAIRAARKRRVVGRSTD